MAGATSEDLAGAEGLVVLEAGVLEDSVDLEAGAAVAVGVRAIGDPTNHEGLLRKSWPWCKAFRKLSVSAWLAMRSYKDRCQRWESIMTPNPGWRLDRNPYRYSEHD